MHIFKDLAIQPLSGEDKLETSISDDKPGNHVKITNASQMNPSWENRSGESYICAVSSGSFSSNPGLWWLHFVSCSLESQTNVHVSESERKQKTQTSNIYRYRLLLRPQEPGPGRGFFLLQAVFSCHCCLLRGQAQGFWEARDIWAVPEAVSMKLHLIKHISYTHIRPQRNWIWIPMFIVI